MKEKMTLSEFRRYCEIRKPTAFIYDSRNNADYIRGYSRPAGGERLEVFSFSFESALVSLPGFVGFKGTGGSIAFNEVKKVAVQGTTVGDAITLYCGSGNAQMAYTLIMR